MSAAKAAQPDRRLYRLAPVDKTGVFLGLSLAQLIVAGTGALIGSVVMVVVSVPIGMAIAVSVGGLGLARLTGEPLLAQIPMLISHAITGRNTRTHLPPPRCSVPSKTRRRSLPYGNRKSSPSNRPTTASISTDRFLSSSIVAPVCTRRRYA